MLTSINPILRGFNPDPSILRVGEDYFIATSTFEWFPGVQIHQSKDLIHWKLAAHPLNRQSQLDMTGDPDSGGVWAPCLTYDKGLYYLVFTDVKSRNGLYHTAHNYLVTSTDILGDWSDPIYLNSSGFDPSLFHDHDGRKWLVNMMYGFWKEKSLFGGIIMQQYSPEEQALIGPVYKIYDGTELGCTEGPHLYKRNGWYYLMTAEGGTGLSHAVMMARSRSLLGPYETDPQNPILTAWEDPCAPIQKAGHADLVETQLGDTYIAHLCGRPLPRRGVCTLGRETCLQKMTWTDDGWLRTAHGDNRPLEFYSSPRLPLYPWTPDPARDDFDSPALNVHFQTLRVSLGEDQLSLTERPGFLRLKGHEFLCSRFRQSLVARRQQSFCYTAATCLEFEPESAHQMAGLVCYYNTENYHYLYISHGENNGKFLDIVSCDNNSVCYPLNDKTAVNGWGKCYLQCQVDYDRLQFYYSSDGLKWIKIGPVLDAGILSDEHPSYGLGFTGAFVGMCCQDLTGNRKQADFDFFEYRER